MEIFSINFLYLFITIFIYFWIPCSVVARTPTNGSSKPWCESGLLYKPYLKYYYGGRSVALEGNNPDQILGPGQYWDFRKKENTYVCINGPAWLYYALILHETGVMVLIKPQLHMFKHDCLLTNYKKSPVIPDAPKDERLLYSILLMGHEEDYRKPSIQLIPAPAPDLVWNATSATATGTSKLEPTGNYTVGNSIVIIGDDTECILLKGRKKTSVRVRTEILTPEHLPDLEKPEELAEYQGSFCKFSYTSLSEIDDAAVNLAAPLEQQSLEYANQVLRGKEDLVKQGCYVPDDYDTPDHATTAIVESRIAALKALTTDVTDPKNVLQKVSDYFVQVKKYEPTFLEEKMALNPDSVLTVQKLIELSDSSEATPVAPCEWVDFIVVDKIPYESYPPPGIVSCKISEGCNPCDSSNADKVQTFIQLQLAIIAFQLNRTDTANPTDDAAATGAAQDNIVKARMMICLQNVFTLTKELGTGSGTPPATDGIYGATLTAWDAVTKALTDLATARTAAAAAPTDAKLGRDVYTKKQEVAVAVSKAESLSQSLKNLMPLAKKALDELDINLKRVKGGGNAGCSLPSPQLTTKSDVITIKRVPKAEYLQLKTDPDQSMYPADTKKTCAELPKPKESCAGVAPDQVRSCHLLKARMGKFQLTPVGGGEPTVQDWESQDAWRGGVLKLIADIFIQSCNPMMKSEYAIGINGVIKGYLMNFVNGSLSNAQVTVQKDPACTGTPDPCEMVTVECDPSIPAHLTAAGGTACPLAKLAAHRSYWDVIMAALKKCKLVDNKQLKFKLTYKDGDKSQPIYSLLNSSSETPTEVEPNVEQADEEYSLNLAIDGLWKMFSTVLGVCMPPLEESQPQITNQFYSYFSEDFLAPLGREWRRNRDNPILLQILGGHFGQGYWLSHCQESSFVRAGDVGLRPPRKLLVNARTEMNFYAKGPLSQEGKQKLIAYNSF